MGKVALFLQLYVRCKEKLTFFLLCLQFFKKSPAAEACESVCMRERVKRDIVYIYVGLKHD